MSSLIRASDALLSAPVRPLALPALGTAGAKPPTETIAASGEHVKDEAQALRSALRQVEETRDQLIAEAREKGRQDALAAFKRDDARLSAQLAEALEACQRGFDRKLEELNRASLLICENALGRILERPSEFAALLASAIRIQLADLQSGTILGLRVSASDFPDTSALQALSAKVGLGQQPVTADNMLAPGECVVDVRLGQIEISLPRYWDALKARFASLILHEAGAS